jgi:hypothetical protein
VSAGALYLFYEYAVRSTIESKNFGRRVRVKIRVLHRNEISNKTVVCVFLVCVFLACDLTKVHGAENFLIKRCV